MALGMSETLAAVTQEPVATETGTSTPSFHISDQAVTSPVLAKTPTLAVRTPPARVSSWTSSFRVVRVAMDDALVVHSGPSEFHAAVGVIPSDGDGVQIIGDCRDLWCPIRHNDITGWVNRYYLAEESSPADIDNDLR